MNWTKGNLRIAAFQWGLNAEDTFRAPAVMQENGFNVDQLCHLLQGDSVTSIFSEEKHGEKLERYMQDCRERGIRVILYFNAHCVDKQVTDADPIFAQRYADGSAIPAYGSLVFTCVNSPWRVLFMDSIAQSLPRGIDGVFLDGPIFSGSGCCCENCRALFEQQHGKSIEKGSFQELTAFRTKHITRFVADCKKTILDIRPEVVLYANNTGLAQNVTGCDIDALFPHIDLIATEGGFMFYTDPNETSLWKGASSANYLESKSQGKPYVIFAAGNHTSWARSMHTPAETRLLFASAVAHGAQVWYGIHGPLEMLNTPGGQAAKEMNRFLASNETLLTGTQKVKKAAILWSKDTLNAFPEDVGETDFTATMKRAGTAGCGSFTAEFKGLYNLLVRDHIQLAIIDETNILSGELSQFTHLYIPNAFCMKTETAAAIRSFVQEGGSLVATMATSYHNTTGDAYTTPLLADVFGLQSYGETTTHKMGCSYMKTGAEIQDMTALPARIAGCEKVTRCQFSSSAQILLEAYEAMPGSYAPMETTSYPVMVRNQFGKGQCIYMAADLGESLENFGNMDVKQVALFAAQDKLNRDICYEGLYQSVTAELRYQPESRRQLLHLVNYTGHMQRPIVEIIPCKDIGVSVKTKGTVASIYTTWHKEELPFCQQGDVLSFTVPSINEYELVVIELAI